MKTSRITVSLFIAALIFFGCEKDAPVSIYDSGYQNPVVAPVVTSVVPETHPYVLGGVTTILINGSGFGTDTSKLIIYFNSTIVKAASITPTQIKILAPTMIQDSIRIRLYITGSDKFATLNYVSIRSVMSYVKEIDTSKYVPAAITFNKNGDLFASVVTKAGVSDGIYQVTSSGTTTQYASRGTEPSFSGLKARGDSLYAARRVNRIVSRNSAAPNVMNIFSAALPTTVEDFDYDAKRVMWTGGNTVDGGILRYDSLKSVKQFPFTGTIRSVRVYNGALYVVNEGPDTSNIVYKIPIITADSSLGAPEKYFDLSATVGNKINKAFGITFDNQGNLYVGTDAAAGVYVVSPAKTAQPLYNGVIGAGCRFLAWGKDSYLYVLKSAVSGSGAIFKVDMLGKLSAPYHGQ